MAISHPCAFRQSESFSHLIKFELIVVPKYLKNIEKVITFQVKKSLEDVTPAETTSLWTSNKVRKQTTGLWTNKQPSCEHQTKWGNGPLVCEQRNNHPVNIKQSEETDHWFVNKQTTNLWTSNKQRVCEKKNKWILNETTLTLWNKKTMTLRTNERWKRNTKWFVRKIPHGLWEKQNHVICEQWNKMPV